MAEKNCGSCFFFSLKGISSLAPCGTCKFNKENHGFGDMAVAFEDRWVTDSDAFWKDKEPKVMTEAYQKDAMKGLKPGSVIPVKDDVWPYPAPKENALDVQVGGSHYKTLEIQPIEFCHKNKLGPCESNIVKYITRWKDKGGKADLEKVKHYVDLLIQLEGL
jgi:hypothetical protein